MSVDMYNSWFINFAPKTFRDTRIKTTKSVEVTLHTTGNLKHLTAALLMKHPEALPTLRMCTCPPLAVDRLIGLAGVSSSLVKSMELDQKLPPRMDKSSLSTDLGKIVAIVQKLVDPDIFVWLGKEAAPSEAEVHRAATIVADRLCGSVANPIIRNAQEQRQLAAIAAWLQTKGYQGTKAGSFKEMKPGTFGFRVNVPVTQDGSEKSVNIPMDVVVVPKTAQTGDFPLFIEAKSAGDFTNVNKRRKEEATKMAQLRATYGDRVNYVLFLCGYFDTGYLGYEAAEGIDWVWEHRIGDLALLGL